MLDIVILALVTAFLFYKLYSVLGDTSYSEISPEKREALKRQIEALKEVREQNEPGQVVDVVDIAPTIEMEMPALYREAFDEVRKSDPSFSVEKFVDKTKVVYEYILNMLADGNLEELEPLVSREVLTQFRDSLENFEAQNQKLNVSVLGFKNLTIAHVKREPGAVLIAITIEVDQIVFVQDRASNEIVIGSKKPKPKVETWTFLKNLREHNKIWKLVSTDKNYLAE